MRRSKVLSADSSGFNPEMALCRPADDPLGQIGKGPLPSSDRARPKAPVQKVTTHGEEDQKVDWANQRATSERKT